MSRIISIVITVAIALWIIGEITNDNIDVYEPEKTGKSISKYFSDFKKGIEDGNEDEDKKTETIDSLKIVK